MTSIINDCLTGLNSVGKAFCTYAGGAFVQLALLVLLLFAIDLLLRKRVRAVVRYCVWLLVLVKLILPPTLALSSLRVTVGKDTRLDDIERFLDVLPRTVERVVRLGA